MKLKSARNMAWIIFNLFKNTNIQDKLQIFDSILYTLKFLKRYIKQLFVKFNLFSFDVLIIKVSIIMKGLWHYYIYLFVLN